MRNCIIFSIIFVLLSSCKDDDTTFIDEIELTNNVNNSTGVFHFDETIAKINESGEIYGYANNGRRFYTNDDFLSIKKSSDWTNINNILYDDGETVVVRKEIDNESIISQISADYGFDFSDYAVLFPEIDPDNISRPSYSNESVLWSYSLRNSFRESKITVNKIVSGNSTDISTFEVEGYSNLSNPGHISFYNERYGWITAERDWTEDNTFECYRTLDGGVNWEGPYIIGDDGSAQYKIIHPFDENHLVVYSGEYGYKDNEYHYSADGGLSWATIDIYSAEVEGGGIIRDFNFVSPDLMFGISILSGFSSSDENKLGLVYKSTDMGRTFKLVNDNPIYVDRVFFLNEDTGLVTTESIVQKTIDGGKTWEVLVFPFSEFD